MNEEQMRKEFEEWIVISNSTGRVPNFIMKNENGEYVDRQTTDLWISWKASRESMEAVKLPDLNAMCISTTAKNKIISAITSAGYKVEE